MREATEERTVVAQWTFDDAAVESAAQILAEQAPFYFADASEKMGTKPNPACRHITKLMLAAAMNAVIGELVNN
jgi:hypothetical protein